jgi:hypothetical protein
MSEISSRYNIQAIEAELDGWYRELNLLIGPLALTMAIGCSSLRYMAGLIFSLVGAAVLISIQQGVSSRFSKMILELRKLADTDPKAAEVLTFVNTNFFGNWRYFSYMAGFFSIFIVAAWFVVGGLYAKFPIEEFSWMQPYLPKL